MTTWFPALLVSLAMLVPGCFTTAGAVTGASVAYANEDDPDGSFGYGESIAIGGALGLALDVLVFSMAVSSAGRALDAEAGR